MHSRWNSITSISTHFKPSIQSNPSTSSSPITKLLYLSSHSYLNLSHSILFLLTFFINLSTLRAQSQPFPCQRWAQQTTISLLGSDLSQPNATLWIQGGQVKSSPDQTTNTWTNALLALDLTRSWNAGSPSLTLVLKDNGNPYSPPAVSLGALWSSADGSKLYLWGGQFADNPYVSPGPMNTFEYNLLSNSWRSINTLGDSVLRTSEGAAAIVPDLGSNGSPAAFYFGGHLDWGSVQGWSTSTPRVFLNSIVQLDLGSLSWKNYTTFASSSVAAFNNATTETAPTIRADGTLTYVPSIGTNAKGALVAIGGGQNFQSTAQNSNRSIDNLALDIFDIGTNSWVKQATQGQIPPPRVNHCAVRGTAKVNGVPHHQIFVYGGQIVNGSSQSTDLYMLSIPGFTWTFVGDHLNAQPSARAGHTCDLVGSQMIVIGGYVASDLLCDSQSVYVFDTTTLTWQNSYVPGLPYRTPDMLASAIGGTGVGHSTSSAGSALGGDGSKDPDRTTKFKTAAANRTGAIVGGVVGGLAGLFLLLLLLYILRRRRRREEEAKAEAEAAAAARREKTVSQHDRVVSGMYYGSDGVSAMAGGTGSIGSREEMMHQLGIPNDKHFHYFPAASDDPEHDTEGFEPQFSTRLVPRQHLRVMNPEEEMAASGSGS